MLLDIRVMCFSFADITFFKYSFQTGWDMSFKIIWLKNTRIGDTISYKNSHTSEHRALNATQQVLTTRKPCYHHEVQNNMLYIYVTS